MRQQRGLFLAAVAVIAMVSLSGCSSSNGSNATPSAGSSAGSSTAAPISGQLKVAVTTSQGPATQAEATAFEKKYPGVTVTVTQSDTNTYEQTTRTQLASGTAPDVMYVWSGSGTVMSVDTLGPEGSLLNLSDQPWASAIPKAQKAQTQSKGKTYILPLIFGAVGAIYNESAFKKAGVHVPTTWKQLLSTCDSLNKVGITPMALGLQTPANAQFIDMSLVSSLVYATDPTFDQQMAEGKTTFENAGWKAAMNEYLELNKHKCFQANPLGTGADQALQMVSTGQAAMSVQVNASLAQVQSQAPSTKFSFFALPGSNKASDLRLPVSMTGTFGISAKSKNLPAAKAFLDFMSKNEAIYANVIGTVTIDPSQLPKNISSAGTAVANYVKKGETAPYSNVSWPNAQVQAVQLQVIQNLFAGTTTVTKALQAMQDAYDGKTN